MIFEWCTDGSEGVGRAEELGVKRLELCAALEIGGITPAESLVKTVKEEFRGEVFVMIRPRGGDFVYSTREIELMKEDIRMCANHGAEGVVFGALQLNGALDLGTSITLLQLAHSLGLKATFHRAIDFTKDPVTAFRDVQDSGFDYVLSSGGANTAKEGAETLMKMAEEKNDNCQIIAGSGVDPSQVNLFREMGLGVHCTARLLARQTEKNMGGVFSLNEEKIIGMVKAINHA